MKLEGSFQTNLFENCLLLTYRQNKSFSIYTTLNLIIDTIC